MIVQWLDDAVDYLQSLRHYIAPDNVIAAKRVVEKILHSIEILSEQPGIGKIGRVPNTRELVVSGTPYIIPYRVKNNIVEILRIFHCAMQWPKNI